MLDYLILGAIAGFLVSMVVSIALHFVWRIFNDENLDD